MSISTRMVITTIQMTTFQMTTSMSICFPKIPIASHEKSQTWKLVSRKSDMRPIVSKWVFKFDLNPGYAREVSIELDRDGDSRRIGHWHRQEESGVQIAQVMVRLKTSSVMLEWEIQKCDKRSQFSAVWGRSVHFLWCVEWVGNARCDFRWRWFFCFKVKWIAENRIQCIEWIFLDKVGRYLLLCRFANRA